VRKIDREKWVDIAGAALGGLAFLLFLACLYGIAERLNW